MYLSFGGKGKNLYPLVGVGHHGNQEVDQDDGGDQHVKGKNYLEEIHQPGRVVWGHVQFMVAEKRGNISKDEFLHHPLAEAKQWKEELDKNLQRHPSAWKRREYEFESRIS